MKKKKIYQKVVLIFGRRMNCHRIKKLFTNFFYNFKNSFDAFNWIFKNFYIIIIKFYIYVGNKIILF